MEPAVPARGGGHATGLHVVRKALLESVTLADSLASAASAGATVLLIINDSHRATQTRPVLTALGETVRRRPDAPRFRILVATGAHQVAPAERRAFESATLSGCGLDVDDVSWHNAFDADLMADIGEVRMHRWLADHRFLLPIGSVEPHYFAGVTGPHKTVTIGCMSLADIERNHAWALSADSDGLRLRGNPVFEGIARVLGGLESAGKSICAIGQVARFGEVLEVAVGRPLNTLDVLLPQARTTFVREIPEPADVLHLRVPPPLDRSLYQADKALKNNHRAVRDGGGIVLEADCPEGIGPGGFLDLLRRADDYATAKRLVEQEGYSLGDHKALRLRQLTDPAERNVRIAIVSPHVDASDVRDAGMELFSNASSAVDWLADVVMGPFERGLIVEDAGNVSVGTAAA